MDMIKMMSIDGFVEYYLQYMAKIKELKSAYRKLKRSGKTDECLAILAEHINLTNEAKLLAKKYATICTKDEIQKALAANPENSLEREAVAMVWEVKSKQLKILSEYFWL